MQGHKIARTATAAIMAGLLFASPALAASKLTVSDTDYEGGTAASGEGWTWDGANDMGLNGYNGGTIFAEGDLTVTVSGENTVRSIQVYSDADSEGNLTLVGEEGAQLTLESEKDPDSYTNNYENSYIEGSLEVDNLDLDIHEEVSINNNLTIKDSTVDGEADGTVIYVNNDLSGTAAVTIENSHVHLVSTEPNKRETTSPAAVVFGGDATYAFIETYIQKRGAELTPEQYENLQRDYPEIASAYDFRTRTSTGNRYLPHDDTQALIKQLMNTPEGQAALDSDITFNFVNVTGDTEYGLVADAKLFVEIGTALFGPDKDKFDVLIDPVPEEEKSEEKSEEVPPAEKTVLPATADMSMAAELVASMGAAGVALTGAAAALRKRKH